MFQNLFTAVANILLAMACLTLLGRVVSFIVALLATCTVAPIMGFNVYFNAFKVQFGLAATAGE